MGGDPDRLSLGRIVDEVRVLVPVWFAQAKPIHSPARRPVPIQIRQGAFGIAVLPGVEAFFLAVLKQFDDALRGMPSLLMLAQQPVEMGVTIDGIAPNY